MTRNEHTIIVGVDYSNPSIAALDQALVFSKALGNTRLLAVLVLPGGPTTAPRAAAEESENLVCRSRENLMALIEARAELHGGMGEVQCKARVVFGDPAQCLLELAEEREPYALAIGTNGRRGLDRMLMGSVAESILRNAACTVWVARSPQSSAGDEKESGPGEELTVFQEEINIVPSDPSRTVLCSPHLDSGRVVLHLLDEATGRRFLCSFSQYGSVSVEPLERRWVTPSLGNERGRVANEALAYSRLHRDVFEQLFAELARRRSAA